MRLLPLVLLLPTLAMAEDYYPPLRMIPIGGASHVACGGCEPAAPAAAPAQSATAYSSGGRPNPYYQPVNPPRQEHFTPRATVCETYVNGDGNGGLTTICN